MPKMFLELQQTQIQIRLNAFEETNEVFFPFDFDYGTRTEWMGYEKSDILLFCPTPGGVFVSEKGTEREIWNGDFTGEALFYTKKGFIEVLTKH